MFLVRKRKKKRKKERKINKRNCSLKNLIDKHKNAKNKSSFWKLLFIIIISFLI